MLETILAFDTNAMLWVQENLRNPFLSAILIPVTKSGNAGILFIITGLLLICFKRTRKMGTIFLISLAVNFIISNLFLKNIVARIRPFDVIEALTTLVPRPHGYSFPSGHTSSVFACMVTFFFTNRKIAPYLMIYAVLMGFSRVYVGVHYPTDVITGAIIGTLIACVSSILYNYIENKFKGIKNEKNK